jgi:hypothetical protein
MALLLLVLLLVEGLQLAPQLLVLLRLLLPAVPAEACRAVWAGEVLAAVVAVAAAGLAAAARVRIGGRVAAVAPVARGVGGSVFVSKPTANGTRPLKWMHADSVRCVFRGSTRGRAGFERPSLALTPSPTHPASSLGPEPRPRLPLPMDLAASPSARMLRLPPGDDDAAALVRGRSRMQPAALGAPCLEPQQAASSAPAASSRSWEVSFASLGREGKADNSVLGAARGDLIRRSPG